MGVAAYNRGSIAISRQFREGNERRNGFEFIDRLNAVTKRPDAGTPFDYARIARSHSAWWIECPKTGFGYCYRTLPELMSRWRVVIISLDMTNLTMGAIPMAREAA